MGMKKPEDNQELGLRVAQQRQVRGLPQIALAADGNMNKNTVNMLESGKSEPAFSTLVSICETLKCEPNDIFPARLSEKDPPNPEIKGLVDRLLRLPPDKRAFYVNVFCALLDQAS